MPRVVRYRQRGENCPSESRSSLLESPESHPMTLIGPIDDFGTLRPPVRVSPPMQDVGEGHVDYLNSEWRGTRRRIGVGPVCQKER